MRGHGGLRMRLRGRVRNAARVRLFALLVVGGLLLESVAAAVLVPLIGVQAAGVIREGALSVIWGDTLNGTVPPGGDRRIFLTEDAGDRTELFVPANVLAANGGVVALAGRRVVADLESAPLSQTARRSARTATIPIGVRSLTRVRTSTPQATQLGAKPYLNILCKFGNLGDEPMPPAYFNSLMDGANPYGLNAYWREASLGAINLDGSASTGWFALPQSKEYYFPFGEMDFDRITPDCLSTAAPYVNFGAYVGINLVFNSHLSLDATPISGAAWGGSYPVTQNGFFSSSPMTWLPPWAYRGVSYNAGAGIYPMTHEMGHAFNLAHSADPLGAEYYDAWDVMSAVYAFCPLSNVQPYGCLAQHANGYHKGKLGWIPGSRTFTYAATTRRITLRPLNGDTAGDHLLAVIPLPGSNRFTTVEFRHRVGFDRKVPGDGVIIHDVDELRGSPSWVQGGNGAAGAVFAPGQFYTPPGTGVTVTVGAVSTTGATVVISNGITPAVTGMGATSGGIMGGTPVVLSGTNLSPEAAVLFGNTPATGVFVGSNGTLTAIAPALPEGVYTITVTNPDGRSGTIAGWRTVIVPNAQPGPRGTGAGANIPAPAVPVRPVVAPGISTPLPAPSRR